MSLTARDLDEIRRIVREELARDLGRGEPRGAEERATADAEPDVTDAERLRLRKMAEDTWARLRAGTPARRR